MTDRNALSAPSGLRTRWEREGMMFDDPFSFGFSGAAPVCLHVVGRELGPSLLFFDYQLIASNGTVWWPAMYCHHLEGRDLRSVSADGCLVPIERTT